MNKVAIDGVIFKQEPLAYTPAGTAVARFWLKHQSEENEAGLPRKVMCEIEAIALGVLAKKLGSIPQDTLVLLTGFLAAKNLKHPRLVLHVTDLVIDKNT